MGMMSPSQARRRMTSGGSRVPVDVSLQEWCPSPLIRVSRSMSTEISGIRRSSDWAPLRSSTNANALSHSIEGDTGTDGDAGAAWVGSRSESAEADVPAGPGGISDSVAADADVLGSVGAAEIVVDVAAGVDCSAGVGGVAGSAGVVGSVVADLAAVGVAEVAVGASASEAAVVAVFDGVEVVEMTG